MFQTVKTEKGAEWDLQKLNAASKMLDVDPEKTDVSRRAPMPTTRQSKAGASDTPGSDKLREPPPPPPRYPAIEPSLEPDTALKPEEKSQLVVGGQHAYAWSGKLPDQTAVVTALSRPIQSATSLPKLAQQGVWFRMRDSKSGRYYYVNSKTRTSTWQVG